MRYLILHRTKRFQITLKIIIETDSLKKVVNTFLIQPKNEINVLFINRNAFSCSFDTQDFPLLINFSQYFLIIKKQNKDPFLVYQNARNLINMKCKIPFVLELIEKRYIKNKSFYPSTIIINQYLFVGTW